MPTGWTTADCDARFLRSCRKLRPYESQGTPLASPSRAILMWNILMKRNWQEFSVCVLYKVNEETIDHLFLGCPFDVRMWEKLGHCLQLHLPQLPPTTNILWSSWKHVAINKHDMVLWDLSVAATFWGIWRVRNNRIFNDLPDHLIRLFMPALLSFFTGSISFQEKIVRGRGGL